MTTYTVFRYGPDASGRQRPFYVVRWKNGPPHAPRGERSTKQRSRRKAEEWASKFVASLAACDGDGRGTPWKAFVLAYEERRLANLKSAPSYRSALAAVERYLRPKTLDELDADAFETFRRRLIAAGKRRSTAASYAKHLRAALGWAEGVGMLKAAPKVKTGQTDKMRGRPLTLEEFERMLTVLPRVVGQRNVAAWRRVLIGAWSIGLRRSEFANVYWDREDRIQILGLNAGTARIWFPADMHKARRDMLLPLLPEAIAMLRETSQRKRVGPVFGVLRCGAREVRTADGLGRVIIRIGELARIVSEKCPETGRVKWASIHDLRKSLADRLVQHERLTVPEVARMMRHRDIKTTLDHYARLDIGRLGEKLVSLGGCISSCTTESADIDEPLRKLFSE